MSHSNPNWYESLQGDILKEKTFNSQLSQKIILRSKQTDKIRSNSKYRVSFVSLAIICLGVLLFSYGSEIFRSTISTIESFSGSPNSLEASAGDSTQTEFNNIQGGQTPIDPSDLLPAQNDQQEELPYGAIDISKVPANEILIPRSVQFGDKVVDETEIWAENTEYGLILRTIYTTPSGVEIRFTQAPATKDVDETLQGLFMNSYTTEKIEQTQIQGHEAVYVDGQERKVAHLITKNHFFTAAITDTNGTIDDCIIILEQIELTGE